MTKPHVEDFRVRHRALPATDRDGHPQAIPPILTPSQFINYCRRTSPSSKHHFTDVLLCLDPDNFGHLVQHLQHNPGLLHCDGTLAILKDPPIGIAGHLGIGAPALVARCEELAASGATRFISLGTSATIHPAVRITETIICDQAFSDEGTSRHYYPHRRIFPATPSLLGGIQRHLSSVGLKPRLAPAWTTDAPYRETRPRRNHFRSKGARIVEMEASGLYMLAMYRGFQATAVCVVGDSIAGSTWISRFNTQAVRTRLNQIALHLLAFLAANNTHPAPFIRRCRPISQAPGSTSLRLLKPGLSPRLGSLTSSHQTRTTLRYD
jgi:uridine phosphorylase